MGQKDEIRAELDAAQSALRETVAAVPGGVETAVRKACRDAFKESRLLQRILPDIDRALEIDDREESAFDSDEAMPGGLWDPEQGAVSGGVNWSDEGAGEQPGGAGGG